MSFELLLDLIAGGPGHRGLDEVAAVVEVAAHHHPQRAVGSALRLQRGLVAVRQREDRKTRALDLPGIVELERALDRGPGRIDDDVVETDGWRPADDGEARVRGLARWLDPARQQIVDARLRHVGLDREPAFTAFECGDASVHLDRDRPAHEAAEIEAQLAARGLIERGLDADFGIGVATRLAIVQRRRRAVELHVALDPVALLLAATCRVAASTFWIITMCSAAKFETSMLMV